MKTSFGPRFEFEVPSNIGLKLSLSLDQTNKGVKNGVGPSFSVSKQNLEATATVGSNLSRKSLECAFTFQKNTPDKTNTSVQVKDRCPKDVFLFDPSNLVTNGRFVVSHNIKFDGDGIETTACVLPFQTIRDKGGKCLESRDNKQIENKPTFTEKGAEKHETQRVIMHQMQMPLPTFMIRRQSTIVKLSILGLLARLFLIFVKKLVSFLKIKKIR